MKKSLLIFLFGLFSVCTAIAQQTTVKGSVKDAASQEPLPDVLVTIEGTEISTTTDATGAFIFDAVLPLGEQVLRLTKLGYLPNRYPIVINEGETVDITDMIMDIDVSDSIADLSIITLSDDELSEDGGGADNISGMLQSSQDVFQRTAAFEFSSSFFRIRGLNSENSKMLINGIEMNKMFDGRPQWSNWGGLNDVLRNQELSTGWAPSEYTFGDVVGSTNINMRASSYRQGGRVTYSSSNRSYTNRLMASYSSGLLESGWAYSFMISRRWGNEGYQDATFYDANSFFASVEKKLNDKHSLNLTAIYTPNRRGKSSPNTQEVYDLKDIRYNEYWGYQDGDKRNSRIKRIVEPVIMLNHYWDISNKTTLNTNFGYQFGELGNSRLDFPGGGNPSPAYYQDLPSYALADPDGPDYATAYENYQNFTQDGQIDWNRIYDANITNNISGTPAAYVLYEDRNDDKQFTANTIFNTELNENILINASLSYKNLKSENFGEITDMLGSNVGYLNADAFDGFQYDYQNPDRLVGKGDKIRYNYNLLSDVFSGFAQAQFKYNKIDFYVAGSFTNTSYQREGLWQHEAFITLDENENIIADNSSGKGKKLTFSGIGAKAGATYKISGKHLIDFNAGYLTKAPTLRNTYSNARENHNIVNGITEEKVTSFDASYIFRSPIVKARLTGFYTKIQDANEVSFYYSDGIGSFVFVADEGENNFNDTAAFVQEILHGVDKKHIGMELGIEAQVTPTIKLKGVAALGQYTYDNNPFIYITSSDFGGRSREFTSNLKDYKIAGGPQNAYSFGFEYRDPDYWWFGATANYFTNTYVDVSPWIRSEAFYLDSDGLPLNDYDPEIARELLKQEKFDDYLVVNLIGGKSWKIDDYYIGFFASINNILDEVYKTGGFEQGRNANYTNLREDFNNPTRVFGPKYWYGRGTNYFVNVYFRF